MDLEFDPLDYILPPPISDDKKIFIRRDWGVVPPKFEAVITDLGTSEKKKSFFKRLWQKLKSLFLRSR
jgi:hypothetical protein